MNSLSWLLYFADILGNLKIVLVLAGIALAVLVVVNMIVGSIEVSEGNKYGYHGSDFVESVRRWNKFRAYIWVPIPIFFLACLCPTSNTMYAIAASEMGEKFSKTETFNKAEQALNAWLDHQIKGDTQGGDNGDKTSPDTSK